MRTTRAPLPYTFEQNPETLAMLQIITGKFFQTEHVFTTLHRGTLYTNYQALGQDSPYKTQIGRILPSTFRSGLATITYELVEKIEGVPAPGVMTSTGG